MPLKDVRMLWIGSRLSPLEEICIASFLKQGHSVFLHTYRDFAVPNGTKVCDANELFLEQDIFVHKKTGSYATFSDLFRYKLLQEFDCYWADTDVFCLRPFDFDQPYVFGRLHDDTTSLRVENCVMAAPSNSDLLQDIVGVYDDPSKAIAGLKKYRQRAKYRLLKALGQKISLETMPWGAGGPLALTHFVKKRALEEFVLGEKAFSALLGNKLFHPGFEFQKLIEDDQVYAAHFCHSAVKPRDLSPPRPGSFYEWAIKNVRDLIDDNY